MFTLTKGAFFSHTDLPESGLANLLLNDRDEPEDEAPSDQLRTTLVTSPVYATSFELGERGGWSYSTDQDTSASQDSFSYYVSDGAFDSAPVTVTLQLSNADANSPPSAIDACHEVPRPGSGYEGNLSIQVSDSDDEVLNYRMTREPSYGSLELELNTGAFRYLPHSQERGYLDSFDYEVTDLRGGSDQATFSMVIGKRRVMPLDDSITRGAGSTTNASGAPMAEANSIGYAWNQKPCCTPTDRTSISSTRCVPVIVLNS